MEGLGSGDARAGLAMEGLCTGDAGAGLGTGSIVGTLAERAICLIIRSDPVFEPESTTGAPYL